MPRVPCGFRRGRRLLQEMATAPSGVDDVEIDERRSIQAEHTSAHAVTVNRERRSAWWPADLILR